MDKWSKRKASETCGGLGMTKYVDSNEARRLGRLKTIRSSVSSNMGHSGWQRQQIEKRRKEQLSQRKRDAKKKQLGNGIQVDTKISKSDAISKCGLKLKASVDSVNGKAQRNKTTELEPQKESSQKKRPNLRLNRCRDDSKKQAEKEKKARFKSNIPCLKERSNGLNKNSISTIKHNTIQRQDGVGQKDGSNQKKFPVDEGKENSDNSVNNKEPPSSEDSACGLGDILSKKAAGTTNTDHAVLNKHQAPSNNKKHFHMDIDSLRREHADAIKMLEELDKCEGNRRRSLDSDDSSYDGLGYQLANDESYTIENENTLDDEFVRDCSNACTSVIDVKETFKGENEEDTTPGVTPTMSSELPASFLNMSHLSISLRKDFDGEVVSGSGEVVINLTPRTNASLSEDGASNHTTTKTESNSVREDEEDHSCFDGDGHGDKCQNNPTRNRSFTLSRASCEESDFWADADCSSDDDGYSSGTF